MARYTGPKSKIARKLGSPVYGPDKNYERRPYPPGFFGPTKKRRKISEYGVQLKEKQKARFTYGLLEKQFYNLFQKAVRSKGITGEVFLQLLESRLDNVVFRMGIAPSRAAARQLVTHRHILVNGNKVNIPSYQLREGDIVSVREKSKSLEVIGQSLSAPKYTKFSWIEWDNSLMSGRFLNKPNRDEIPEPIKEQLIVELYSKN